MIIIQANGAEGDLEEKILALLRREDIAAERVSLSSRHTLTFPELTIDGRSQQAFQNGTALALTRIGKTDHSLYDGSWSEWGMYADLPIATGDA